MSKTFKFLLSSISIVITILIAVFAINQTSQVILLAKEINPDLGNGALYFFLFLYLIIILIPIYLFIRLPKPLIPPEDMLSEKYGLFIKKFGKRLSKNKNLRGFEYDFTKKDSIQKALDHLELKANEVIKESAGVVFLTTAISQSGRLDGLTVLIAPDFDIGTP